MAKRMSKAQREVLDQIVNNCGLKLYCHGWKDRAEAAKAKLAGEKWVSVEERLPEYGRKVPVAYGSEILLLSRGDDGQDWWWVDDDGNVYEEAYVSDPATDGFSGIKLWFDLPLPPTEGKVSQEQNGEREKGKDG